MADTDRKCWVISENWWISTWLSVNFLSDLWFGSQVIRWICGTLKKAYIDKQADQHKSILFYRITSTPHWLNVPEEWTGVKRKGMSTLPATRAFSRKLTSDFIFLFCFTSYGSVVRTETLELISCDPTERRSAFLTDLGCTAGMWSSQARSPSGLRGGVGWRWPPPPPWCLGPGRAES